MVRLPHVFVSLPTSLRQRSRGPVSDVEKRLQKSTHCHRWQQRLPGPSGGDVDRSALKYGGMYRRALANNPTTLDPAFVADS